MESWKWRVALKRIKIAEAQRGVAGIFSTRQVPFVRSGMRGNPEDDKSVEFSVESLEEWRVES